MAQLEDLRNLRAHAQTTEKLVESLKLIDPEVYKSYLKQRQGLPIFFANLDVAQIDAAVHKKELMLQRARNCAKSIPCWVIAGVRLAISFPEIYVMQITAILEAAAEMRQRRYRSAPRNHGSPGLRREELEWVQKYVDEARDKVEEEYGVKLKFQIRHNDRSCSRLHIQPETWRKKPNSFHSVPTISPRRPSLSAERMQRTSSCLSISRR